MKDLRTLAQGACAALNKLAYKNVGLAPKVAISETEMDYRSVANEVSDSPFFRTKTENVVFYFSDSKGFYFRIFKNL
ncbi:MAG: hypothetical protein ACK50N_02750 [Flavobacteriales bacterium]|jgi:hypothetical protein